MKMISFQIMEFAAAFAEAMIGELVIEKALGERKATLRSALFGGLLITAIIWGFNQQNLFSIAATISGVLGIAAASCVIYRVRLHDALVVSSVYLLLIYVVDFLTIVLFGIVLKENQMAMDVVGTYSVMRVYCLLVSKGLLFAVYYILSKKVLFKIHFRAGKMWMGVILATILVYYLAKNTLVQISQETFWIWFLMLMLILLVIYIFFQYSSMIQERAERVMANERNLQMAEIYEKVTQTYKANEIFYHDLKNHHLAVENYLENEQYAEAKEYMGEISAVSKKLLFIRWTGIDVLDALLKYKSKEAESLGVHVDIEAEQLSLKIPKQDLVVIMGNALNNALEACREVEDNRWIRVVLKKRSGITFMKVSNSCKEFLEKRTGGFLSAKTDGRPHGLGLISMDLIVKKYNGTIELTGEGESFTVLITFFSEDGI